MVKVSTSKVNPLIHGESPVGFSKVLYSFYTDHISQRNLEQLLVKTFKQINHTSEYKTNFWNSDSSLIASLEILDKNELIETDLKNVLQNHNNALIKNLSFQKSNYSFEDTPFYIQLLLNRLRYTEVTDLNNKILYTQLAENLIQQIEYSLININVRSLQRHTLVLINLYKIGIYKVAIENTLNHVVKQLEKTIHENEKITLTLFNNLTIYPIICATICRKSKIDMLSITNNYIKNGVDSINIENWQDNFYLFNTLIKMNTKFAQNKWNRLIENILEKEIKYVHENHQNLHDQIPHLLALTSISYHSPILNSWDEILLVPSY
ncbi:hypothetical protein [Sphingobacterium sp. UDSM-2020]|uniref:hypothetical protein n=1 Tax=Sphingobacterium sp. UDSM-2020 TaxID=2795738 RepID=UPI001935B616|nr:hypothetical protein [Sphingobacterium sp. UDSM-2020]QQD11931.1 hypothetical protein JAZ75_14995 [Sphingobacterium sp. UDSM-2020]